MDQVNNTEIEIIELDDRLDMTIDPLTTMLGILPDDEYCHNSQCCKPA